MDTTGGADASEASTPRVTMSRRERIGTAVSGMIAAAVIVPSVLNGWAPTWFVLTWAVGYVCTSATMMTLAAVRPSPLMEHVWSTLAGAWIAVPGVSWIVWGESLDGFWASVAIALAFIAFEIAALPFVDIREWRGGVSIVTVSAVVTGFVAIGWAALVFIPLCAAMIDAADRMRTMKQTLERRLGNEQRIANHDELTGLLNRRGFAQAFNWHDATDALSLLMLDANRFKSINDTYSHGVGDHVLMQIADALRARLGDDWKIGRQGGDEFVAFTAGGILPEDLTEPIRCHVAHHGSFTTIEVALSAGLVTRSPGEHVDALLSKAGYALQDAKRSGGGVRRFIGDVERRFDRAIEVASSTDANGAMADLVPNAQIIVDDAGTIMGCEVLCRWRRANGQILTPAEFLPLVGEMGLLPKLDDAMLEESIAFAARFNNRPNAPFVSVNLTPNHLQDVGLVERIESLLSRHRVDPQRLMVEITETGQFDQQAMWEPNARALTSLGIQLAIDDFGSGYSSIERIQQLPVTHLKFDRSLIERVSGPFGEIVDGVARFARASRIAIIAEGIETIDEMTSMSLLGITLFQGYQFGYPAPLDEIEQVVIAASTDTPAEIV